jgi:hypothetical protein
MPRDLEQLRQALWEEFEKAVERQPRYEDFAGPAAAAPMNFAIAGRQAMGQLAQAIVAVESALRDDDALAKVIRLPGK